MDIQEAEDKYLEAAIVYGTTLPEDRASVRRVNKAVDTMIAALKELRQTPDQGEIFLKELLSHESSRVRAVAARDLLPIDEATAIEVLTKIAEEPPSSELDSFTAFSAKMALKEWRAGRLEIR